ncbi:MAG: DNA-binding protein [Vicinamibacterales bacterium]
MADAPHPDSTDPAQRPPGDRLDSWKEIANYLRRDVTTVQRWERREGMPVHRHVHDKLGSVYAFRSNLDAWAQGRHGRPSVGGDRLLEPPPEAASAQSPDAVAVDPPAPVGRRLTVWSLIIGVILLGAVLATWQLSRDHSSTLLDGARFKQLTDFAGNEHAAAVSRDGRFVAFLSDRDGPIDVWVTQAGTGKFYNLTQGTEKDITNSSVRTLGFTPDGSLVTYWRRVVDATGTHISIWAAPVLGGPPRPHLEGVAEFDWTREGTRLVYHTPGPGDPMFVRDKDQAEPRPIFTTAPGRHSHFPVWAPDQSFVYFVNSVEGAVPERMDIWRIPSAGGSPERITYHDARVTHPAFVDAQTLAYLASDPDGSGPWLYTLDVTRRVPHRVSFGLESYSSLAAAADGSRLIATATRRQGALWRLPITEAQTGVSSARRIPLTTGTGSFPRLGPGYLLYVSSKGESDSIWKLQHEVATEVWSAPGTRIIGPPAVAPDGRRIAFSTKRNRQTSLHIANVDGTGARIVTSSLELQGAPVWAPDSQSILIASTVGDTPRLFNVPLDGRAPSPFVSEHSIDAAWSRDGTVLVYSGADVGTTFPLKAVTRDGRAASLPTLTLTRGARHVAFLDGGLRLAILRGEMGHKNLWLIDLATGVERQLTDFGPDFTVRDFDITPDGREIVIEQVQQHSDLVLIELSRR